MNLHNEIMNIQIDRTRMMDQLNFVSDYNTAYKLGHRDARHVAAELSLKAEAKLEEAMQLLLNVVNPFASKMTAQELHTETLKFLQENK